MPPDAIVAMAIMAVPIVAIVSSHKRKILELQLKQGNKTSDSVIEEIRDLKRQITELRDTTTRYDMSFDTALQRLEGRMNAMEQKQSSEARPTASVGARE